MRAFLKIFIPACYIVALTAATAVAFGEIRYPDRALNLRDGRSPSANWVGSLVQGQPVRVAFLQNGWVAVFEPNETHNDESAAVGYANLKYIKAEQMNPGPVKWGSLREAGKEATIRAKASGLSEQVGTLSKGQRVRMDFPDDDWVLIFPPDATIRSKMGGYGFVKRQTLKPVSPQKTTPAANASIAKRAKSDTRDVYTEWGKVVSIDAPVKVYRERKEASRQVTTLAKGRRVRVDFLKDGWVAVFQEDERLRKEYRAIGFARLDKLENKDADSVSLAATIAAATSGKVEQGGQSLSQTTVPLSRSRITETKQPDPKPDQTAHGYKYKLLDKSQVKKQGETWVTLKVFLATTKLPNQEALNDFSSTLWKKNRRAGKKLAVLLYLPGMNTRDLSYGVVKFGDEGIEESWVRKTTLFGTEFF